MEILLIGVLGVVANRGVQDRDEMLLDFVEGVVADHVEAFKMVSEEYLEVGVVSLVEGSVDVVVVGTGVRSIFHLEVLHEHKVLYHLHVLYFAVLAEEVADVGLSCIIESAHI